MKKLFFLLVNFLVLGLFVTHVFADPLLLMYDGVVHKVYNPVYELKVNGFTVYSDVPPLEINGVAYIPARATFEALGGNVNWNSSTQKLSVQLTNSSFEFKINSKVASIDGQIKTLPYPVKMVDTRAMIPASFFSTVLNLSMVWNSKNMLVTMEDPIVMSKQSLLQEIIHTKLDKKDEITVHITNYKSYSVMKLSNPDRIVFDFQGVTFPEGYKKIDINSSLITSIRASQFQENVSRIVLDTTANLVYKAIEGKDQLLITVARTESDLNITQPTATPKPTATATPIPVGTPRATATPQPTVTSVPQSSEGGGVSGRGDDRDTGGVDTLALSYEVKADKTEITVGVANYTGYSIFRLTGPDRIVLDIPNLRISGTEQKLEANTSLLKTIRYARYGEDTTRMVLDLSGQHQYQISEQTGKLIIMLEKVKFKNITYYNNMDRTYLKLKGAGLTQGGETLTKLYKESYEDSGKRYKITFAGSLADLGTGIFNVNDEYLASFEVSYNTVTKETSVTFNAKDKYLYNIITRTDSSGNIDDTAITILKQYTKEDRLVVIDPGHGGWDPGAAYESVKEKDLNLDIAMRLNALLKAKNVKTYIMREDDCYVGLYERAHIANKLNASLFLSIHNNAFTSEMKGTETLYYPQSASSTTFNSKTFAQNIQNAMISALKTVNRGIIERPNLVVLKATSMPAALAEVAFVTNQEDRANLMKDEFKQNAAQALCEAIIKSLGMLK